MSPALLSPSAARSLSHCLSSRAAFHAWRPWEALGMSTASAMAAANNHNSSSSSSSRSVAFFFFYRRYCYGHCGVRGSSDRRRKGMWGLLHGSGYGDGDGDGVWSGARNGGRWRREVSYSSPDGTPFYYPGEGFADLGIHPEKLLQPGEPETFQVKIRDVMPVGYFVDMPSGREGYLPANDLGFSGGIERLRTIFQVGQEVTVRITFRGGGGRELLSIRKFDPERPPVEPPKVARSSGSGKRKISSMMRRRAQQQQQQQQQAGGTSY